MKMKKFLLMVFGIWCAMQLTACDAFQKLLTTDTNTAQGAPYELILAVDQPQWQGALGDTLRSVLCAPVEYLPQQEPVFDVMRVTPDGFKDMITRHRNIMKVIVNPSLGETSAFVQHDVTAQPQLVVTLQGPSDQSLTDYVSENRHELVLAFEQAERDRALAVNSRFDAPNVEQDIRAIFDFEMNVPTGYFTANKTEDFLWARKEYPKASQGFMIYSYPYEGKQSLSAEALTEARNRFAKLIPGPRAGSYMTTAPLFTPTHRMFRMEGRLWCELRGFWDVEGDYMGGPFVSYSTIDTRTNRVVTLDCYIYSPDLHKRNFMRGVEHLIHGVHIPTER